VFLASQLTEISGRYLAHVQDIREFLQKEKLPVPSPDAIPQLLSRLGDDARFRADVASLMRATMYQEREGIGYEQLLGILVAAAAGIDHDLKSDSQEADLRALLRFLLQSRRSTFPAEPESGEARVAVEPEPRVSEPVRAEPVRRVQMNAQMNPEPVLHMRGTQPAASSMKLKLRGEGPAVAVAEADSREADDVALPPFLASGLFGAEIESEAPRWRSRSIWIVGVVCIALGLGLGAAFHGVVSAAGTHIAQTHLVTRAVDSFSSKPKTVDSVAPTVAPQESAAETSNVAGSQNGSTATPKPLDHQTVAQPVASGQGGSAPQSITAEASPGVPVTVVKQEVTAWPSEPLDSREPRSVAPSSAKTRSIVQPGSAGMTAANVIFSPAPAYPAAASAARVEGQVTVQAVVNPEGKVVSARAVSGPPLLRDAATEAVQRWRYSPLLENGKPVAVTTVAILDFKVAE
jgi:TonB family protein